MTTVSREPKKPKRPPRGAALPRPAVTDALRRALFEEWAAHGYRALRLEQVAARAGVGKAALYRRWPSKLAMVRDALDTVGLTITDAPDTGALESDLLALLASFRRVLRHPLARRIIPDIHGEQGRTDAFDAALAGFTLARRQRVGPLIERAIARGELPPDVDREMATDLLAAPIYWRMVVTQGRADQAYLRRLARALVAALCAGGEMPALAATPR